MCLNPKKAFQSHSGAKLTFVPRETFVVIVSSLPSGVKFFPYSKETFYREYVKDGEVVLQKHDWRIITHSELIDVPCQNCLECKLQSAREWASRCLVESKEYADNYFLTLTYDDQHVPTLRSITPDGDDRLMYTLKAKDMQDFMRNLRRYYKYHFNFQGIRFFGCGEYGTKTFRPHLHICLFNLPIPEDKLILYSRSPRGEPYYRCEYIEQVWSKGAVIIGSVTPASAAYVSRYCTKKLDGFKSFNDLFGVEDEFIRMSNRPPIGDAWYQRRKDELFKYDYVPVATPTGGFKILPTKLWKRKYKESNPDDFEKWRNRVSDKMYIKWQEELKNQDLSEIEYLEVKAENLYAKKNFLKVRKDL